VNKDNSFSRRHAFLRPDLPITIRYEAPDELRSIVLDIAYESGLSASTIRNHICSLLRKRADSNNWSEYNIQLENNELMDSAEWYEVYDIVENLYDILNKGVSDIYKDSKNRPDYFSNELNEYFLKAGIGWQLVDGFIEIRGDEPFESSLRIAKATLEDSNRQTAGSELHQALRDLSRRPDPDKTGAIQHAMAALECVARDVTGDSKATLGEIIKRHPNLIPSPLDQSVDKAWGFASENARHLREGKELSMEDTELVVSLSATIANYLVKKTKS
jgi:hypothetical protein